MTDLNVVFEYSSVYKPTTRVTFHEISAPKAMGREFLERAVREGIAYMNKYPDVPSWHQWSGDTFVFIGRDEESLDIVISRPTLHGYVNQE